MRQIAPEPATPKLAIMAISAGIAFAPLPKAAESKSMELKIPDEPEVYRVRFPDVTRQTFEGRSVVEVK